MSEILVANTDAAVTIDGVPHVIERGRTMARSTHPIVTGNPGLWQPPDITYDVEEPDPATQTAAKRAAGKPQGST